MVGENLSDESSENLYNQALNELLIKNNENIVPANASTNSSFEKSFQFLTTDITFSIKKTNIMTTLASNIFSSNESFMSDSKKFTDVTLTEGDAPKLFTKNLIANAGQDIHVYYPSDTCILNGTLSKFWALSNQHKIVKWNWVKLNSSPAFGVRSYCLI